MITADTDTDTLDRYCVGFQPMSAALRIACAANLGVVMLKKVSAPEAFRLTIWLSMVGSVTS
ncbi:hypothetical protein D3C84_1086910 [compost metagenome]